MNDLARQPDLRSGAALRRVPESWPRWRLLQSMSLNARLALVGRHSARGLHPATHVHHGVGSQRVFETRNLNPTTGTGLLGPLVTVGNRILRAACPYNQPQLASWTSHPPQGGASVSWVAP
jgi:hypothetical protein